MRLSNKFFYRLCLVVILLIGCFVTQKAWSSDLEKVFFVKKLADHDELWVKDTSNNKEQLLIKEVSSPLLLSPKGPAKRPLKVRGEPQLSIDGKKVFFLADAWETSHALHSVDIDTGVEQFIAEANSLRVIRKGKYKGKLAVEQHKYFLTYGSYDWIWLIDQDGTVIGPLSEEES